MDDKTKDGVKTPEEDIQNQEQKSEAKVTETVEKEAPAAAEAQAEVAAPSEFSQIVWPKPGRVWSETLTVIIVAAIVATIIFFVDMGLRTGIEFLIQ